MSLRVPGLTDEMYILAFMQGLKDNKLRTSLMLTTPTTRKQLNSIVVKYLKVETRREEDEDEKRGGSSRSHPRQRSPKKPSVHQRLRTPVSHRLQRPADRREKRPRSPNRPTYVAAANSTFTPLVAKIGDIYAEMKDKSKLPEPTKMKFTPNPRQAAKWCDYQKQSGHHTDDYRQLQQEIEKLIQRGHLSEYVDNRNRRDRQPERGPPPAPAAEQRQRISTIAGGLAGGGDSRNKRKKYARRCIYAIDRPPKLIVEPISFSDADFHGIELPHDDPLVIAPFIGQFIVERMMVDTCSSSDILFARTFDKLGYPRSMLR